MITTPSRLHSWIILLLVGYISLPHSFAKENVARPPVPFPPQSVDEKPFSIDTKASFRVFCFLGVECPVARQYGGRLQKIAESYSGKEIQFVGINSNPQDTRAEVLKYASDMGITFPILKDSSQEIARHYGATRTAEVVVLDPAGLVRYRGRVDDQFSPGVARQSPTSHDLCKALDELLAGKPVTLPETVPVGCLLTFLKPTEENAEVTFTKHIAPMLFANCLECHRRGEIGPFDVSDYDEIRGWAEMMVEVMEQQRMPPWHASPEFGSFKNARYLPEDAIEQLRQWIDDGMPYGSSDELPAIPPSIEGWRLPNPPELVVDMRARPYRVPAEGTVDYQYFVVDPGLTEDRWVSAAQIIPGVASIVHHAIVFVRPPDGSEFTGIGWLTAYVPGQFSTVFPPGYARKLPAGSKLVFQMHYTPDGTERFDNTRIGLNFVAPEEVTHQVFTLIALDQDFEIPPHAPDHVVQAALRRLPEEAELLAVAPHMHLRGKGFQLFASQGGSDRTLLQVPHYDFNWQHTYEFTEPLPLKEFDSIHFTATFDNSTGNPFNPDPDEHVMWGDQTWEEMAVAFFEVAKPIKPSATPTADPKQVALVASEVDPRAAEFADNFLARFDTNRDGVVKREETPRVVRDYSFWTIDLDRDGLITRDELIQAAKGRSGR